MPTDKSLKDPTIHLYLVDTTLQILLAQRDVPVSKEFMDVLRKHVQKQQQHPLPHEHYVRKVQQVWSGKTSAQMREKACAVQGVSLDITIPQPKNMH